MRGPYITIKVKDNICEIGTEADFQGPDAFDELVEYLRQKYNIPGLTTHRYLNGR